MKAALIPPKGYYATAMQSDYHLMLAQITDREYVDTYGNSDDYVIIDNGAAEGEMVSDSILLRRAMQVVADEIVVPDTMGHSDDTVARAHAFWESCTTAGFSTENMKFMGVVQSQGDRAGVIQCVEAFEKMPITALGIPRHLVDKDKHARYMICSWLKSYGYDERFEVHLLGTNPKYPSEVCNIVEAHPWVRGIDSSLPYNYTIAGKQLSALGYPYGGIKRPGGYFDTVRRMDTTLLQSNIDTFMRWASGTEGTSREV